MELNSIINTLAPPKITQYKTNYTPYIDDNIKRQMDMTQTLLNKAINTHGINDWIEYKNHRNLINKQIRKLKKEYIRKKFKQQNNKYKFIKQFNNTNKQQVPSAIIHNNLKITSPKKIAEIANNFFVDKIEKIKQNFTYSSVKPIDILKILKPRTENKLVIPNITLKETIKLINKL